MPTRPAASHARPCLPVRTFLTYSPHLPHWGGTPAGSRQHAARRTPAERAERGYIGISILLFNPSTYRSRPAASGFEVRFTLDATRANGQPRGRLTSGLDHQKALSALFRSLKVAFEIPSSLERRSRCSQSGHWRLMRLKKPAGENEDCEAHTSSPSRSIDERGRSGLRKGLVERSGTSGRLQ